MNDLPIKHLKPRKNSKYHQGYIPESLVKKYVNSKRDMPIIYRSGLELQFIQFCESSDSIVQWSSETLGIPYFNRLLNKMSTYWIDFIIMNKQGKKCLVEVKPENQCKKPKDTDSVFLKRAWITNVDKWQAARKYADEHDMNFWIFTENSLKNQI